MIHQSIPIFTIHLISALDKLLITLLKSIQPEEGSI